MTASCASHTATCCKSTKCGRSCKWWTPATREWLLCCLVPAVLPCGCLAALWLLCFLAVQAACVQACQRCCYAPLRWHVAVRSCRLSGRRPAFGSLWRRGALQVRQGHPPPLQTCQPPLPAATCGNQYQLIKAFQNHPSPQLRVAQPVPVAVPAHPRAAGPAHGGGRRRVAAAQAGQGEEERAGTRLVVAVCVLFFSLLCTVLAAKHAGHSLCGACPPWMGPLVAGLFCASAAGATLLRWLVLTCCCPAHCCFRAAGAASREPGAAPRARIQC